MRVSTGKGGEGDGRKEETAYHYGLDSNSGYIN